ncbi:fatty acyl-AMP ligase [Pseudoalteromonas sp. McH1-42]|uniref:fatty acyl-AMP ligase n=1 Tax=Pseudoalteromonas sp. McH1-42 TaxID=2917752 RepID=UPI001EF5F389|nr:fatty acyl-AMP ligase [Pseudoalteromonas sp. McH1-42]MCG7563248.1 fatty acyl-AMP ligase [Pseudoalteromonas sp. McH1-42]
MIDSTTMPATSYQPDALPTFVDILTKRASKNADDTALVFLQDGEQQQTPMTYRMLHDQAQQFACGLRAQVARDDRVILLFQSSYEFAVAFLGCMYAGVISIPLPIPGRRKSEWTRMQSIVENADCKLIVSIEKLLPRLHKHEATHFESTLGKYVSYETLASHPERSDFIPVVTQGSDIAFLQYTSGSTGAPKGVALTHDNLIENQLLLKKGFRNYGNSVYLSWLPLFHDMGLIGNFMQAIYIAQPFIFMAPNAFLQKPYRWLKAISDYRVRVSGAPNFAYQLCVDKITDSELETLDLSSWEVAFNGAEPVRASTLKQFAERFKRCGFKADALYPCYGTAESTLIISGAIEASEPVLLHADRSSYEQGRIVPLQTQNEESIVLVASGTPLIENSIAIVCPDTQTKHDELHIGEIWLTSPCNAPGYWANQNASTRAFKNRLANSSDERDFLNTGDLGFLYQGNIYITGRSKDLLIFNGRNIYPQDIEACSELAHAALKPGRCAATSLYKDDKERLVLVHELNRLHARESDYNEVFEAIRIAVYKEFAIPVHAIALVSPSSVPMTSSGKIRRQSCKSQFIEQQLDLVASWTEY